MKRFSAQLTNKPDTSTISKTSLRKKCVNIAGAAVLALAVPGAALAQGVFDVSVTTGGSTGSQSFTDFETFINTAISNNISLTTINGAYTNTSAATVNANFRGVPLEVVYPNAGPTLTFNVPSLGISIPFNSQATRAGNENDLELFLEQNINDILGQILKEAVATTAFDPVAGNPASLQGRMIEADFGMGTGVGPSNSFNSSGGDGDAPNLIGFGARLGQYSFQGTETTTVDLPFSYVVPLSDPRYAIIFDAPLTYVDTDGSASFAGSFGVGVRIPVLDNWTLTPAARIGAVGSIDLGALGTLYSASLTSNVEFSLGAVDIQIGNMISYVETAPIDTEVDGYSIEYDVSNVIARNGIEFGGNIGRDLFGLPMTWEASAVNTQITGDDVFIDNYTDVALSIGTKASQNGLTWDQLRLGITYTFSDEDYDGFRLNFGYQF